MIDLRSDTVTKPTAGMLDAMMNAKVGDDVLGEDPTVIELENKMARMFGMEAGLFCPSGTMTNQIALRVLTEPQDEVICHKHSHIYLYEGGGMMSNSHVSAALLDGELGILNPKDVLAAINPDDVHRPVSKVIALENTMNKGGGSIYPMQTIRELSLLAREKGLYMHLDGARLFNAIAEKEQNPLHYGQLFDTISICLSKGLGCPVGSVLLSTKDRIKKAKRVRKVFGGGMRQAGYLAAAGIYALNHHVKRLTEDHQRARILSAELEDKNWVKSIYPVETNIVIVELVDRMNNQRIIEQLKENGLLGVSFGPGLIRLVTHLQFTNAELDRTIGILRFFEPKP
jgi:threonine aldolase